MDYSEYIKTVHQLELAVDSTSKLLQRYSAHKGKLGLLPDHIKQSADYRRDKAAYNTAFKALRDFNATVPNSFKRQRSQVARAAKALGLDR